MVTRMLNQRNTLLLLVEVQLFIDTMEIIIADLQKTGIRSTSISSYTTPGKISKGHSILPQEHLLNHVHYGFNDNSLKWEVT